MKKIVVFGGTGLVGSHICKEAIQNGWEVVSISRKGAIPEDLFRGQQWKCRVSWQKGDVSEPSMYSSLLDSADAIVHSIGILREPQNTIHGWLMRKISVFEREETFEQVNRDSAIKLAAEASEKSSVQKFVFISVSPGAVPAYGIDQRYQETKRQVEEFLAKETHCFDAIVFRPAIAKISSWISSFGNPNRCLVSTPPINAHVLARAIVQSLKIEDIASYRQYEASEIEPLANSAF